MLRPPDRRANHPLIRRAGLVRYGRYNMLGMVAMFIFVAAIMRSYEHHIHTAQPRPGFVQSQASGFRQIANEGTCVLTISSWNNFGFVQVRRWVWGLRTRARTDRVDNFTRLLLQQVFFASVTRHNPQITCLVWCVADHPESATRPDLVMNAREQAAAMGWHLVTIDEARPVTLLPDWRWR